MSLMDQSYNEGGYDQAHATVFSSPSFTSTVELGPSEPLQGGGGGGFKPAHGVLLVFVFAVVMLFILGWLFRAHNLG